MGGSVAEWSKALRCEWIEYNHVQKSNRPTQHLGAKPAMFQKETEAVVRRSKAQLMKSKQ